MNAQSSTEFVPDSTDPRALRDAFGRFATGVTVVTCDSDDGPVCITANSFSSLSLEPALVMWAIDKGSKRFGYFSAAQHFAIHVLAQDQGALCRGSAKDMFALKDLAHSRNAQNVPLIPDCLVRFECTFEASHDAGDHVITVGKVVRVTMGDGEALAFFKGKLGSFTQTDPV